MQLAFCNNKYSLTLYKICRSLFILLIVLFLTFFFILQRAKAKRISWQKLQKDLFLADKSTILDSFNSTLGIIILKASTKYHDLILLNASQSESKQRFTLKEWVDKHNLFAAINASMFWKDQLTSTGYMRNYDHTNNRLIHHDYGAFLCFNPVNPELLEVNILDRTNQDNWKKMMHKYQSVVQGFRMISSNGKNAWEQSKDKYSVAAFGLDHNNNILFIFSQLPRTIHNLNEILLRLPLDLKTCMFLEGGLTAGLYIKVKNFKKGWHGISDKSLWTEGPGRLFMVPNVIGIIKKD